jgi:drug/metabolite transporter (DMT)-like permease
MITPKGGFMSRSATRNGLLLALAGFALLSAGDAIVKSIAGQWPGTAVAALRYVFGAIGLGIALWMREGRAGFRVPMPWVQFWRGATVSFASLCFFAGIFLMPLAEATVINFVNPMLTALLSAFFLKERAPRAAWVATAMAFVGVIIVVRPDAGHLGWAAVLPLLAALGMGILLILNRITSGAGSILQMQFLVAIMAVPFLVGATIAGHLSGLEGWVVTMPTLSVILRCMVVAGTASMAHMLVYMATMRASAAVIAPMLYVQLLVATVLGWALFGDRPDLATGIGALFIVGGGLYLWNSQRAAD